MHRQYQGGRQLVSLIKWMEKWLSGGTSGTRRFQTFRWLMLLGLVGAAFMVFNSFIYVKDVNPVGKGRPLPGEPSNPAFGGTLKKELSSFREYEEVYQSQLKELLGKIVGVGEVEVIVTIDSTEEIIVERNTKETQQVTNEKDQQGATRNISNVTRSGEVAIYEVSGGKQPLIIKTIKPKVRGVVVVAKGAENLTVKKMLVEAVERGLDIAANRISILPRKQ
jgi:stage III sporulation protein AG